MFQIAGYQITELLHAGMRNLVYRGLRERDRLPVIIKAINSEYPNFREVLQFRNEYTIASKLDFDGIIKHLSFETCGNSYALIMEDKGTISLQEYIARKNKKNNQNTEESQKTHIDLEEFLQIAIQLTNILDELIRQQVIHKDINPTNIQIHPQTKKIELIDFSIASILSKETQQLQNPSTLEGTLPYISPEQTGRMNRGIDYRSDFYSLGITFYEMLNGKVPFDSDEPMELVHYHIAKTPPVLAEVQQVPLVLSNIVMKLLKKNAEDRYQSASGLKYDLEKCLQELQETGDITDFPIAEYDISDRFTIPEKLYGREKQVKQLLEAFESVARGNTELVLVAGPSGVGKTAVVQEVHKPIVRSRGYFIQGKFNQLKYNIPFYALLQAFRDLIRQILSESNLELQQWKDEILQALGTKGRVITDVLPELETIIGKQPPVVELSGIAIQNRFHLIFTRFIRVFANQNHPLVIFLDDLQWADPASLKLIKMLMNNRECTHLLLIGSYRNNEIHQHHPLYLTLKEIEKQYSILNTIVIEPLTMNHVKNLIADTLGCTQKSTEPVAKLVYQKTKGNAFFTNQFFKALYKEKLIRFNNHKSDWECDIVGIKQFALTNDLIEFINSRLQEFSSETHRVLQLAACIGSQFDLDTLSTVSQLSKKETNAALWDALQEGFILPHNQIYRFYIKEDDTKDKCQELINNYEESISYRFLHDRVQQAAYSLIDEGLKQQTHFQIGRLLFKNTPADELDEKIFTIVNQFNYGLSLVEEKAEKETVVNLNLLAARKAKISTAYDIAIDYLDIAQGLIDDGDREQYSLNINVKNELAQCLYLCGNFERMQHIVNQVENQAINLIDKLIIYEVRIQSFLTQGQPLAAVSKALEFLDKFGVKFLENHQLQTSKSEVYQKLDILVAFVKTKFALTGKSVKSLETISPMKNDEKNAIARIISKVLSASYIAKPDLLPLLVFHNITLFIKHGNNDLSAFTYAWYGLILCGVFGDIYNGCEFGNLALRLLDKFHAQEIKSRTLFIVYCFIYHWKNHIQDTIDPLLEAYQTGIDSGDNEYAAWSAFVHCQHSFFAGQNLDEVEQKFQQYNHAIAKINQEVALVYNQIFHQTTLNLLSELSPVTFLEGGSYSISKMVNEQKINNDKTGLFFAYINQAILFYLFHEFQEAQLTLKKAEKYLDGATSLVSVVIFHFYSSLTCLQLVNKSTFFEKKRLIKRVINHQNKMKKWAKHAPMNYLHKWQLVEAEKYRVDGNFNKSADYYDIAIQTAKDNKYLQEEAIANELAGRFYLERGKIKIAQTYIIEAYYCYLDWGAKAKLTDFKQRYPQLLNFIYLQKSINRNTQRHITTLNSNSKYFTNHTETTSLNLDLLAVIKSTQAISSEIELEKLISILMKVVVENAGADKAALIVNEDKKLEINSPAELASTSDSLCLFALQRNINSECELKSIPLESSQEIPISLINYVWRTCKTISINNFETETRFLSDSYFLEDKPQSVLCIPIIHQRQAKGILYLENHLVKGAFKNDDYQNTLEINKKVASTVTERIEVLQILTSQIAISLENALLFNRLKGYSQNLEQKNTQLAESNYQLEIAKNKADAANRAKSEFISNISHELRTPLNGILGYTQMLQKRSDPLLCKQGIETIQKCGEHLLTLIEDILDLSKIEARKMELYLQPVSLQSFLYGIIDIYHHKAQQKSIIFEYQVSPYLPQTVEADEKRLRQVLINLLSNAMKFTDQGSVKLFIKVIDIDPESQNNQSTQPRVTIRFEVEDTGMGISPENINKIFLPFEQVGKLLHKKEGTGLGLAISQEIIHLMGSSLLVKSNLGYGSRFWFDVTFNIINTAEKLDEKNSKKYDDLINATSQKPTSTQKKLHASEIPPKDILKEINYMVSVGMFFEIEEKMNQLILQNQDYASFCNEVIFLSKEFEGKRIQEFLDIYMISEI